MAKAAKTTKTDHKTKPAEIKEKQVKHAQVIAEAVPAGNAPAAEIEVKPEEPVAKAGKRSAKSKKAVEEKQAKQVRKTGQNAAQDDKKSKSAPQPIRSKAQRAGKKYREAAKLIDKSKKYTLAEALDLVTRTSSTKFDSTVELHVNLGVDPKQADQNVRDSVVLPAGSGKVLAEGEEATKAKAAGADITGTDEIFAKLDKEEVDFDVLIATPDLMGRLGKHARLLGPRGLMPNPKSGTVSPDPANAVIEAKKGRVEYRVDQAGIIHLAIGKASFGAPKLIQNAEAVLTSIRAAKPASLKGIYIKSVYTSSTMGPSVKIETAT
jgi:large subunit ribosomal protein L1